MSWFWAPVFFVVGAFVGVIITSLIAYDSVTDRKRGRDDE